MFESKNTIAILQDKGKPVILSERDVALKRDKTTKKKQVEKKAIEKSMTERKRILQLASTSSEEEVDEIGIEISTQKEKEMTLTEGSIKDTL